MKHVAGDMFISMNYAIILLDIFEDINADYFSTRSRIMRFSFAKNETVIEIGTHYFDSNIFSYAGNCYD